MLNASLLQHVKAVANAGCNMVVTGGKVGEMALHFLNKHKIMVVRWASPSLLSIPPPFPLPSLPHSFPPPSLPCVTAVASCDVYAFQVAVQV